MGIYKVEILYTNRERNSAYVAYEHCNHQTNTALSLSALEDYFGIKFVKDFDWDITPCLKFSIEMDSIEFWNMFGLAP